MSRHDQPRYADKHRQEPPSEPQLLEAVKRRSEGAEISCRAAFSVAEERSAEPREVGVAADRLEISIVKCQLGLFGYAPQKKIVTPAPEVSPALGEAIRSALVAGRLPCAEAWRIADRRGIPKMEVSSACEALGIKISPCQLAAF